MTQMKTDDDNRSAMVSNTEDSHAHRKQRKQTDEEIAEALKRKQEAEDNRRLADSAGQMLTTLLDGDDGDIKQVIISAIIATVHQPGSKPPREVPALMTILRAAAEEQLVAVQRGNDAAALHSSIEFGRWVGIRTIKLGEARNIFRSQQERKATAELSRARHLALGLPGDPDDGDCDGDGDEPHTPTGKESGSATKHKWKKVRRVKKSPATLLMREVQKKQKEQARRDAESRENHARVVAEQEEAKAATKAKLAKLTSAAADRAVDDVIQMHERLKELDMLDTPVKMTYPIVDIDELRRELSTRNVADAEVSAQRLPRTHSRTHTCVHGTSAHTHTATM